MSALKAEQIETSEIVCFAEGVLAGWLVGYGEKLGGNDFTAVLEGRSAL